jgi:hypothetical protein
MNFIQKTGSILVVLISLVAVSCGSSSDGNGGNGGNGGNDGPPAIESNDGVNTSTYSNQVFSGQIEFPVTFDLYSIEVEFDVLGNIFNLSIDGIDLLTDTEMEVVAAECQVSSTFGVDLYLRYIPNPAIYGPLDAIFEIDLAGTMSPVDVSMSLAGVISGSGADVEGGYMEEPVVVNMSLAWSYSENNHLLEGSWLGSLVGLESPSIVEGTFDANGQGLSLLMDGGNIFDVDPNAIVQCDVDTSFDTHFYVFYNVAGFYNVEFNLSGPFTVDPNDNHSVTMSGDISYYEESGQFLGSSIVDLAATKTTSSSVGSDEGLDLLTLGVGYGVDWSRLPTWTFDTEYSGARSKIFMGYR